MLYWVLVLFLVAIAGMFGFTGIAMALAGTAKILFFVFLGLFLVSQYFTKETKPELRTLNEETHEDVRV
jgi:uncharacterized membrane protein YtjA (UPF0391 family)